VIEVRLAYLRGKFLSLEPYAPRIISASDDALIREHARELGAISFFRKPIDDQVLLDAIRWANSGITV
jgi:FixJ family two-component response regulator